MTLLVYNTLTRKKQEFFPNNDKIVKMYVCGPTVYNYISIGNARPIIVFNMIRNYLEYKGYKVTFVQNITDIEDKIIKKANEEGVDTNIITQRYTNAFLDDLKTLQIDNIDFMPKATEMINEIIEIIKKIISNGFAYISNGDVYFDVSKYSNYGKLSGQVIDQMISFEEDNFSKRNKIDFTLWKSAKPNEPFWDSPWGKGRPGWHIECSAMSLKYLDHGIDIHGGGIDLVFPHHENEIAQSEAAFPDKGQFVKYWLHNGMIEVKEEKMSKSKGLKSDWILKNLLKKYSPNVIKMYILSTHYRSPLEFSIDKLEDAKKSIEKIINFLRNLIFLIRKSFDNSKVDLEKIIEDFDLNAFEDLISSDLVIEKLKVTKLLKEINKSSQKNNNFIIYLNNKNNEKMLTIDLGINKSEKKFFLYLKQFKDEFKLSMDDDFNSAKAIGTLFNFIKKLNSIIQKPDFDIKYISKECLLIIYLVILKYSKIFGFHFEDELGGLKAFKIKSNEVILEDAEIQQLIEQREKARLKKDFKKADEIREKLKSYGIILEDRKEGTIWKRES